MESYGKFLIRTLMALLLPLLLLGGLYAWLDPFKVLRHHDDYFGKTGEYPLRPGVNKGMVTLSNFESLPDSLRPNSFIFGSSVSIAYRIADWEKYLPADARAFHFDSSMESLRSMRLKMEYLERQGAHLDNALIVLAPVAFNYEDSDAPPYINSWKIDPKVSPLKYQWTFLKGFYNREFFRGYCASMLMGRAVDVGQVKVMDLEPKDLDPITNEETSTPWERTARQNPEEFFAARMAHVPDFEGYYQLPSYLTAEKLAEAKKIAALLQRNATDYQIVIGPFRDGAMMNERDFQALKSVFQASRITNLSGPDFRFQRDTAFYDRVHYRPWVAAEIMQKVYEKR